MSSKSVKKTTYVLNRYLEYYCQKKMPDLLSLISSQQDAFSYIGIGVDEKTNALDEFQQIIQKHFDYSHSLFAEGHYEWVYTQSDFSWILGDITFRIIDHDNQEIVINPRLTALLKQENQNWLIHHLHFSMPWSKQRLGVPFSN